VADDDGALVADDDDAVLIPLLLAALRLPPASLIPLAVLLKTSVVALLSAPTAPTTLITSKSKSIAYSGADTPASSLAIYWNTLAPEPSITRAGRVVVPGLEKAMFGYAVSRLMSRSVELLTVTRETRPYGAAMRMRLR
jgi:hypothetical protein